ncbi:MAG: hypothetical protein JF887_06130 [Candidatus Dormibacteraeota bacterium]|uniref:Gram-positive cocci surface proteins LPxTG domain-containing protein n=1 Tax=Candidatus Amunia macphersoniae TaxID=3127014 RepID=A0A934N9F6_9BACT|nr:hypothetical protein [Candidatus Dormibacteraeota bacterium]
MSRRRPTRRRAAIGVALVALAVLAAVHGAGGNAPSVYDGLCLPAQYLALSGSPSPGSASMTYTADDLAQTKELVTSESVPQAQLIIAAGSFTVPAGTTVTVTIAAVAAPSVKPANGSIVGNVYQFLARASNGQVLALLPGHPATVTLEAPSAGGPQVTLERYEPSSWTALKTFQSGCGNTDSAASPSLGLFALIAQGSAATTPPPGGSGGGSGSLIVLAVVAVAAVVVAAGIATTRSRRRRR